jgi:hypothetical protein
VVAQVKALACELPAASGTPLAKWSCPARETAARGITASISASTVRRWLAEDVLKLWRHRSWVFPRDPYFAVRAARVFDLYERIWEARPLGGDEYVLSADEKPGVQVRRRIHPGLPPGPGRPMRVENEYARCGTRAYLAAYDVHRGQVTGRCEPTTGIKPFAVSVQRVFWVVDDGASHRGWTAAARMSDAWPNVVMVHLPVRASWLNRIYFWIQRKLLVPEDFADLPALAAKIGALSAGTTAQSSSPAAWPRDPVTTTSERPEPARGWRCGSPGDRSRLP